MYLCICISGLGVYMGQEIPLIHCDQRFGTVCIVNSVHLRTVSALLACARLAATYRACLWSIRVCTVTSPIAATYKPRQQGRAAAKIEQNMLVSKFQRCSRGASQVEQRNAHLGDDCRRSVAAIVHSYLRFSAMCERSCRQKC